MGVRFVFWTGLAAAMTEAHRNLDSNESRQWSLRILVSKLRWCREREGERGLEGENKKNKNLGLYKVS